jgi:hypothetical protein
MLIDPDELLPNNEAARELRQKPNTLATWRSQKRGPAYLKIGRQVFYRRADLSAWLGARRHEPQAQAAQG